MSCADRSECTFGNHSSDHAHVSRGHDGDHKNGNDENDHSNARECQQSRSAVCAHPWIVAARQVQPAKRVVPVEVRRAHDARSTTFQFSHLTGIPVYTSTSHTSLTTLQNPSIRPVGPLIPTGTINPPLLNPGDIIGGAVCSKTPPSTTQAANATCAVTITSSAASMRSKGA